MARRAMPNTREGRYIEPARQLPSGEWVVHVLPWELQPGDRVIGMTATITTRAAYSEIGMGGYAERARHSYRLSDGKILAYSGDGPAVGVIRKNPPS
jgi:hypothetical protein